MHLASRTKKDRNPSPVPAFKLPPAFLYNWPFSSSFTFRNPHFFALPSPLHLFSPAPTNLSSSSTQQSSSTFLFNPLFFVSPPRCFSLVMIIAHLSLSSLASLQRGTSFLALHFRLLALRFPPQWPVSALFVDGSVETSLVLDHLEKSIWQ